MVLVPCFVCTCLFLWARLDVVVFTNQGCGGRKVPPRRQSSFISTTNFCLLSFAQLPRNENNFNTQVCGLKWSFDDKQLASGGNDNKLLIWNAHSTSPVS